MKGLKRILDEKFAHYHQTDFITKDPISVPRRFVKKQDIEIAAFFAAILAWGNRTMIIRNTNHIMALMGETPYEFICHHEARDLKSFVHFVHRTFNATDLLYSIAFFKHHYTHNDSLETAFLPKGNPPDAERALVHFHNYFFSLPDAPDRTRKHIATPAKKSACKRLNMFLRWMVRKDSTVDFGLWNGLSPADLICPLDTHVSDVARRLGLLERKQNDWKSAIELTGNLRLLDAADPVKYDYALFGMGAEERF
ncbi:MAG: TIGR02757 family protein [Taibaiella sp.]|nr:TIGR02757 family protein [Taibaiella sp.]